MPAPLPARLLARYGPWAVVTGASSGIGRTSAEQLAAAGFHLVLVARRADVLDALAAGLRAAHGIDVRVVATDLSVPDGHAAVEAATDGLDVGLLVAAAGFGTSGSFLDADPIAEAEMLALNAGATLRGAMHFGQRFAARGRGGLVLFGSIVGFQGTPFAAHYAATKAYVQTLAEGLHVELAPRGVDVVASAPGPVHTGFAERAAMRMDQALRPGDVARASLVALGRQTTVLPGGLSKVLGGSLALLPRPLRARIMGRVMGGMAVGAHAAS